MRPYRTDYWLWGVLTVAVLAGLVLVEHDGGPGFLVGTWQWAASGFKEFGRVAPRLAPVLLAEFLVAAAAAWSAHALLVLCGVRLSGQPPSEQAADYDDAPPGRPVP